MNEMSDSLAGRDKDVVEALLEKAQPRPAPPDSAEQDIRAAVRAEWEGVTFKRRRRRFGAGFATAASIALVLAVSLPSLRVSGIAPVEVASIDKSLGTLYIESDSSGLRQPVDTTSVFTGQVLTTGVDSAAGLNWLDGGSLRIDQNTRIEFVTADKVFLHSGKIYFDSHSAITGSGFTIESTHGLVSHVGTQYMTESSAANLIVSVREGEVSVDGVYHEATAYEGYRVQLSGSAQPAVTNTSGIGSEWEWIETVSPAINVDGMSVFDFLQWVGRETGHSIQFESAEARSLATNERLKGVVDAAPREALRLRMMTVDLDARFDPEGPAIIVSN